MRVGGDAESVGMGTETGMRIGTGVHMWMEMGMATGMGLGQKGCRIETGRALGWVCSRARGRAGSPRHAGQSLKWVLPCVSFPPRSASCRDRNPRGPSL